MERVESLERELASLRLRPYNRLAMRADDPETWPGMQDPTNGGWPLLLPPIEEGSLDRYEIIPERGEPT